MRYWLFILSCLLASTLLSGCVHGQIGPLPEVADPEQSAVVYVLRSRMLPCGGERAFVSLDEASPFVSLRGGENAGFRVAAGPHRITLSFELGVGVPQAFQFTPSETYYLLIQPSISPFPLPGIMSTCWGTLLLLTEEGGRHRVRSSKAVLPALNPVSIEPDGSPASGAQEPPGSPPHSEVGPPETTSASTN